MAGWCAACNSSGWRIITDDEVTVQLKLDADPATVQARLAILRNSAVPCEACEPRQHALWKDGHMRPGHRCNDCRAPRTTPTPRRHR